MILPVKGSTLLKPFIKYAGYVVRHKLFVYQEGRKLGLGIGQLLLHDLHKFLPDEFFPYAHKFNTKPKTLLELKPGPMWLNWLTGNLLKHELDTAFDRAWLKHQRRSKHHWQAYVLLEDSGQVKVLDMPPKFRREMVADWRGAGRAIHGKDETASWYEATKAGRMLHPSTKIWVEQQLGLAE